MTSAINGTILFKQGSRSFLDSTIRSNSLAFDITNSSLLYSPSGTTYYEFYPINSSATVYKNYVTSIISADMLSNPSPKIYLLSSNYNAKSLFQPNDVVNTKSFPYWMVGYRTKKFTFSGPPSGTWQATINVVGCTSLRDNWDSENIMTSTISNSSPSTSGFFTNNLTVYDVEMIIDSGTIPFPGITVSVAG